MRYRNRGKSFIDIKPGQFVLILIGVVFVIASQRPPKFESQITPSKIEPKRPPKLERITPRKPPAPLTNIY